MLKAELIFGMALGAVVGMCVCASCPKVCSTFKKMKKQTLDAVSEKCEECKQAIDEMANKTCQTQNTCC